MKKLSAAALLIVPAVAVVVAAGMQAPGDSSLGQLVAELSARLDALSDRVDAMEHGGGAPQPAAQPVLATAAQPPAAGGRTMIVDNMQESDHNDDNSAEIQQLTVETNSLQNTVNSQQDTLTQITGQPIQEYDTSGGSSTNRGDIDRQIAAQRDLVDRYATQLGIKRERLERLQQADNQPKQIIHGHSGQMLITLLSQFNVSSQLNDISPGDLVTWTGRCVSADENSATWLIDTIKEAQQ